MSLKCLRPFLTYQPDQPKPTNTENFHFYSILLSLADKNNSAKNEATEDLRQRRVLKERRTNKTYFHVCKCRGYKAQQPTMRPHEFLGISFYARGGNLSTAIATFGGRYARELLWCYSWLCMPSGSFLYIKLSISCIFYKSVTYIRTDGRTDGRTHPLIEMRGRI